MYKLGDITEIQFGPHFKSEESGTYKYLTARHFDKLNKPSKFSDSYVTVDAKDKRFALEPNDVLLTGKGYRLFAWEYNEGIGPCIPSSLFYRIRVDVSLMMATYLTLYLNTNMMKHQLELIGAGTSIMSIPKKELENLKLKVPSLEEQAEVIDLVSIIDRDITISHEILHNKHQLRKALIHDLIINKNSN